MFGVNVGALTVHINANATQFDQILNRTQRRVNQWATNFSRIGSRLSIAITAPFIALANASAEAFGQFDKAMTETEAVLGGLSAEMKNAMASIAKDISTQMVFSSEELAQAYVSLARAGNTAEQSMDRLGVVAKLAQAGVVDLDETVELLTTAFSSLQSSAKMTGSEIGDFTRLANLLLQASIISEGEVTDFALALTRKVGPALRFTNRDMEEGIALLATYAKMGIRGAFAAERVDILLRDLHAAQIRAKEQWLKYGLSTETAEGQVRPLVDILKDLEGVLVGLNPLQRRTMLQQLGFQFRSVQATIAILGMTDVLEDFHNQIRNTGDIIDDVSGTQMNAWLNSMQALANEIKLAKQDIGQALAPAITLMARSVALAANVFRMLPSSVQTAIVALGALVAILGPFLLLLGQIITVGLAAVVVVTKLGVRWATYAGILSPIITVIRAITAAIISQTVALWASTAPIPVATYSWMQLWKQWGRNKGASLAVIAQHAASLANAIAMFNWQSKITIRILIMVVVWMRNLKSLILAIIPTLFRWGAALLNFVPWVGTILKIYVAFTFLKGIVQTLLPMMKVFGHFTKELVADAFEFLWETVVNTGKELTNLFPILNDVKDFFAELAEEIKQNWNGFFKWWEEKMQWFADWQLMLPRADINQPIAIPNVRTPRDDLDEEQRTIIDKEMERDILEARRAFVLANPTLSDFQKELRKIIHTVEDYNAKGMDPQAIKEWKEIATQTLKLEFGQKMKEELKQANDASENFLRGIRRDAELGQFQLAELDRISIRLRHTWEDAVREFGKGNPILKETFGLLKMIESQQIDSLFISTGKDIASNITEVKRELELLSFDESGRGLVENWFKVDDMIAAIVAAKLPVEQFQDLIDEYEFLLDKLHKQKVHDQLVKDAQSALDAIRTPQEIFDKNEATFKNWLDAGAITLEQFNKLVTAESEKLKETMDENLNFKDSIQMPNALEAGSNAALQRMQDQLLMFKEKMEGSSTSLPKNGVSKTQEHIEQRRKAFAGTGNLGFTHDPLKSASVFKEVKEQMTGVNPGKEIFDRIQSEIKSRDPIERKPLPPSMQQFKEEKDKDEEAQVPITDRLDIIADILRQSSGGVF